MTAKIAVLFGTLAALFTYGAPSMAAADSIKIRLDNLPNPSNAVPYPQTTNNVCVYGKPNLGNWTLAGCRALTTVSGSHDFCLQNMTGPDMDQIKITIDGNNAFWLDKFTTYWYTATHDCTGSVFFLEHTYGIDNDVGYCFSTDSSDYSDPVCTAYGTAGQSGSGPSYSSLWWDYL